MSESYWEPPITIRVEMEDSSGDILVKEEYHSVSSLEENLYKLEQIEDNINERNLNYANDNR